MKKILVLLSIVFFVQMGYSQSGKWEFYMEGTLENRKYNKTGDGSRIQIDLYVNGAYYTLLHAQGLNGVKENHKISYLTRTESFRLDQRVTYIKVYTKLGRNNGSNPDGETIPIENFQTGDSPIRYERTYYCDEYGGCAPGTYRRLYRVWYGNMFINIYPSDISIAYFNQENSPSRLLPTQDTIVIKAPSGYHESVYSWEISDNGAPYNPLPERYQKDSIIRFSGMDLYGSQAISRALGGSHTYIRMKYQSAGGAYRYSNVIDMSECVSAPHVLSYDAIPNKCYGDNTASISLVFDRALYTQEKFQVYLNGLDQGSVESFVNGNTLEFRNLYAGTHTFSMAGYYQTGVTYGGSNRHRDTIVIQDPAPVAISDISLRPVSCYGGDDGTVKVTAKGGVGAYHLKWLQLGEEENYNDILFAAPQDTSYYVDKLPKGRYEFYLSDGNGCYEKKLPGDDGSDIQKYNREITAPAQALQIVSKEVENPKGFQRTDGYISLQLTGGTPLPGGTYHVVWKNAQGDSLRSTEEIPLGEPFTTTLPARGDGTYTVEITDANYAEAYTSCNDHCVIRDTIVLSEPPKLEIFLRETNYVSCRSWKDGAITAHAEGGIPLIGAFPYHYQWFEMDADLAVDMTTQLNDSVYANLPSGYYRVKATDTYGNTGVSEVFFLEEPTELEIHATGSSIQCNGEKTGKIEVVATHATPPYFYSWNTGATVNSLENLLIGQYWVKVTDSRGCYRDTTVAVVSPEQLVIDYTAVDPVCYQTKTGNIDVLASGGQAPYTYLWDTGQTTSSLSLLGAGDYSLIITDNNACAVYAYIHLTDPVPVSLDLGQDHVLCRDQSVTIAPEVKDPNSVFAWKNEGEIYAVSPEVTLDQTGEYILTVTDSKGCLTEDTVKITVKDIEISSELVVSSSVFRNDTIVFVNISDPAPENSEWLIDPHPDMRIVEQSNHVLRVICSENGQYTVGCRSHISGCYQDAFKTITVVNPEEFYSAETFDQTLIRNFSIHPNPSNGIFSATIELEKDAPVRLRLLNLTSGQLLSDIRLNGDKEYIVPYNLQLAPGTYALILETAAGRMMLKVLMN